VIITDKRGNGLCRTGKGPGKKRAEVAKEGQQKKEGRAVHPPYARQMAETCRKIEMPASKAAKRKVRKTQKRSKEGVRKGERRDCAGPA